MKIVESIISCVTVFNDRALVCRTSCDRMGTGLHTLVFDNLPARIEENSIQVNGFGNAIILDVSSKHVNYFEVTKEEIQELQSSKNVLIDKLGEISDNLKEIECEREFLRNIANRLTHENSDNQENLGVILEPEKWEPMIRFYREKQALLNKEVRKLNSDAIKLQEELKIVDDELLKLNQNQYKSGYQVTVKMDVSKEDEINLELSYIVLGAKWKPSYDIRVDSKNKKVKLAYKAMITQNTSEAWENTKIILSTAQVQASTRQKQLVPVYVDLNSAQNKMDKFSSDELAEGNSFFKGGGGTGLGDSVDKKQQKMEIKKSTASVETNKTSVAFNLEAAYSIKNNDQSHEATILINEFAAKLYYSTIPKLEQYAFLKSEIQNNTEYPLLQGNVNVFLDNSFVANSTIEMVAAGEKFHLFLGIDQNIKVEYLFINKFLKSEGIVNKKNKMFFQSKIMISNNKQDTETIVVQDQLPISKHQDLVVELIEPNLKDAKFNFLKKEHEILEWTLEIKPGEKIQLPIQYSIEYPKNDEIQF